VSPDVVISFSLRDELPSWQSINKLIY
jgi:hypothetical protein